MFPPVYTALSGDSDVGSIVGTRIYPHGEAPQDVTRPYVTWQVVSAVPENGISCAPDIDVWSIQINCLHTTSAGVVQLAESVRNAIQTYGHVTNIPINQRDTETRLYWIALQVDWWYSRG
jgi:hypothetical protein